MNKKYDVFISYESSSKKIASDCEQLLIVNKIVAFRDDTAIKWGDNIIQVIAQGLSESKGFLLILNKSFFNKGWTMSEWYAVFSLFLKGYGNENERHIFALLLDEVAKEQWTSFPFSHFLSAVEWSEDEKKQAEIICIIKNKINSK